MEFSGKPPHSPPGGSRCLAFGFLPRRSTWPEAAGQFGYLVKSAHLGPGRMVPSILFRRWKPSGAPTCQSHESASPPKAAGHWLAFYIRSRSERTRPGGKHGNQRRHQCDYFLLRGVQRGESRSGNPSVGSFHDGLPKSDRDQRDAHCRSDPARGRATRGGRLNQTVEVQAHSIEVQTEDAKITTSVANAMVDELPLVVSGGMRSVFGLEAIAPDAKGGASLVLGRARLQGERLSAVSGKLCLLQDTNECR
jgi:hypothetical protein